MQIRDRIKELRRVKAALLRPHPGNWRSHPPAQRDALRGVLAEIGYAGALLARETDDGALELIDGHLRAETTPDAEVPVLVLDVSAAEAAKLLATLDPLAALAETNVERLTALAAQVETGNAAVRAMLDDLTRSALARSEQLQPAAPPDRVPPELYQVVVQCKDETQQRAVYERLTAEGLACRLLVL